MPLLCLVPISLGQSIVKPPKGLIVCCIILWERDGFLYFSFSEFWHCYGVKKHTVPHISFFYASILPCPSVLITKNPSHIKN